MTSPPPETELPSPQRLIAFLQENNWRPTGGRGDLYRRFAPPSEELGGEWVSLLVPLDQAAPDFPELMREAVDSLRLVPSAAAAFSMLSRLTTTPTDQFAFSKETHAPRGWIQWDEGASLIGAARGLLIAGAKSAREQLSYFGNRHGQFAHRFLDKVMMGQTEVGSYVVRAYVPVDAAIPLRGGKEAEEGLHFMGQDAVASRDVSETVARTLMSTIEALSHYRTENSLAAFRAPDLGLSYESVTAVQRIAEDADYSSITISWEPGLDDFASNEQEFVFSAAHVPVLQRAASDLVKPEPRKVISAVGTVHLLTRSEAGGPGVVGMTTLSGEPANKLRVHLSEEDYHRALNAHDQGWVVQVRGDLEKEGNLSWLYHATVVSVIESPPPPPDEPGLFELP